MPIVAIVGRPNVGKSTFFNRLTEAREAIVHDEPGVTRDRHYGSAVWNGRTFSVVDTGGYVVRSEDRFEAAIREQVELTLDEADAIILVVDTVTGITDLDEAMAAILHRTQTPVFVAANKADNAGRRLEATVFYGLGLGEVYPISALNGMGTGDLLDAVVAALPPEEPEDEGEAPRIAFIGQPNVGKSSLVNKLLGENRTIVTEIAGTTRDAIDARMTFHGREVVLVDTAGLRKRAKVKENLEFYATLRTERALERCDVAVLLINAADGLETQDAKVIAQAAELKKGLVIAVNKWDLVAEKETNTARDFERGIKERLGLLEFVPVVFISALTGQRIHRVLELALQVADERTRRIDTSALNEVVRTAVDSHHPPTYRGNYIKINYATQVRTRPPVFAFFANHPQGIAEGYQRYLENQLRAAFGFAGVPLTLVFKKKN